MTTDTKTGTQLTVTVDQLIEAGASRDCAGIAAFREVFGGDSITCEWTREKQIEILRGPLRRWFGWCWQAGVVPMWSLSCADAGGADLRGADLSYANLRCADLSYANLSCANLRYANLFSADLRGADLTSADLSLADLWGAKRPVDPPSGWVANEFGQLIPESEAAKKSEPTT